MTVLRLPGVQPSPLRDPLRSPLTRLKGGGGGATVPEWVMRSGDIAATMDIDFVNDRAWNGGALTSVAAMLSCSRDSSGSYLNDAGAMSYFGAAALRYGTEGVLPELAATNVIGSSQNFASLGQNGGATTVDQIAAPDGSITADLFTASASGAFASYLSTAAHSLTGDISVSVFVKKGNQRYFFIDQYGGASDYVAVFDLDTGTYVGNGGQTNTTRRSITALGDGWYRCTSHVDSAATGTTRVGLGLASGNNVTSVSGNTIYYWGLQIEAGQRATSYIPVKNLALYSEDWTNAWWTIENITISANATTAPDGTMTADKHVEIVGNGNHEVFRPLTMAADANFTLSGYAKAAERRYVTMGLRNSANTISWATVVADLLTGTITKTGQGAGTVTYVGSTIEDVGDGWYRVSLTASSAGTPLSQFGFALSNAATPDFEDFGSVRYDSEAVGSGAFWWGVQLERGSAPSPYWRTGAANNTRAADVITFSDLTWFDGAEDSNYAEWVAQNKNGATVWALDATNDKMIDEQTGMSARVAGATVANTVAAGADVKAAARLKVNDYAISMDGGTVATDTSETAPGTLTASRLGCDLSGANQLGGYIRRVAAFKATAINDAGLVALTT